METLRPGEVRSEAGTPTPSSVDRGATGFDWRSLDLGTPHEIRLSGGTLRYYERGTGPTIVFVHGWLANANLWRKVVPLLATAFRCIVPDFPFGSHLVPFEEQADLTPSGCGRLILDFSNALGLSDVTLVGNDSGGAYSQIATAANPSTPPGTSQRRVVARLVLNSCETAYDSFPPPAFAGLKQAAQSPAVLARMLAALEDRTVRSGPAAYGFLAKYPIDQRASDSYVLPLLRDARILRDASKLMKSAHEAPVHDAARSLMGTYGRPVLFVWSEEDKFFPLENARRYAAALPNARVELVTDAFSFTPEDQPEQLAALIGAFVG